MYKENKLSLKKIYHFRWLESLEKGKKAVENNRFQNTICNLEEEIILILILTKILQLV